MYCPAHHVNADFPYAFELSIGAGTGKMLWRIKKARRALKMQRNYFIICLPRMNIC